MIDALRAASPTFRIEAKMRKNEESATLNALTCGLADSAPVYIAAANSDVSIILKLTLCLLVKSYINFYDNTVQLLLSTFPVAILYIDVKVGNTSK